MPPTVFDIRPYVIIPGTNSLYRRGTVDARSVWANGPPLWRFRTDAERRAQVRANLSYILIASGDFPEYARLTDLDRLFPLEAVTWPTNRFSTGPTQDATGYVANAGALTTVAEVAAVAEAAQARFLDLEHSVGLQDELVDFTESLLGRLLDLATLLRGLMPDAVGNAARRAVQVGNIDAYRAQLQVLWRQVDRETSTIDILRALARWLPPPPYESPSLMLRRDRPSVIAPRHVEDAEFVKAYVYPLVSWIVAYGDNIATNAGGSAAVVADRAHTEIVAERQRWIDTYIPRADFGTVTGIGRHRPLEYRYHYWGPAQITAFRAHFEANPLP